MHVAEAMHTSPVFVFTATIDHVASALPASANVATVPNNACRIPCDRPVMSFMPKG